MANEPKRCPGNGSEPCGVEQNLLIQAEDGGWWCFGHHPRKAVERSASGVLGGLKAASRRRKGLDDDELGPLASPEDAMRWAAALARAVATGRLSSPQGRTALVAIAEWRRSYEADVLDKKLAAWEAAQGRS